MLRISRLMIVPVLVVLILSACQQLQPGPAAPQAATSPTEATQPERPSRLLLIGDYFLQANLGVDAHLKAMAITASPTISLETAILASTSDQRSYTLKLTWDAGSALARIRQDEPDVVVLYEDLAPMTDQQEFKESVGKFENEIRNTGAETVLFMPWEYDLKLKKVTIEEIARVYSDLANELGVKVAPVGLAWQRARQESPTPDLYYTDRMGPSIYGTYLAACVLYATILGEDPTGLPYRPAELFPDAAPIVRDVIRRWPKITDDEAAFLQRIAWETVQEYQAQQ